MKQSLQVPTRLLVHGLLVWMSATYHTSTLEARRHYEILGSLALGCLAVTQPHRRCRERNTFPSSSTDHFISGRLSRELRAHSCTLHPPISVLVFRLHPSQCGDLELPSL
ncbi:hypothetical protein PM082_002121 [Marasmius tenuissimus]|nr:hypothetical protein PM082_002121 [Marasmius tenuissimus]